MTDQTPDTRAMPTGGERPGEHWNARLIRETASQLGPFGKLDFGQPADAAPYDAGDAPTSRPLPTLDEYLTSARRLTPDTLRQHLADMYAVRDRQATQLDDAAQVIQAARDAVATLEHALALHDTTPTAEPDDQDRPECTALCRDVEADRDALQAAIDRADSVLIDSRDAWAHVEDDAAITAQRLAEIAVRAITAAGLVGRGGGPAQGREEIAVRVDIAHPRRDEQPGDIITAIGDPETALHARDIWHGWTTVRRTVTPWEPIQPAADPATTEG